jgi:hypothetical protein
MTKTSFGIFAALAAMLICSPAKGDMIFSIQPATVFGAQGDAADAFEVVLTNTGASAVTVGGFSFEVTVTDPDLSLNSAGFTTTVDPYIFAGHSFDVNNSFTLNLNSGLTLDATDSYDPSGSGMALGSLQSLSLGQVLFSVSPTATLGAFAVTFTGGAANSLSDALGNNINIDTLTPGTIDIVPEPSSLALTITAVAVLTAAFRKRRA